MLYLGILIKGGPHLWVAPQGDDPVELGFQFLGFLPVALHQPSIQGSVLGKSLNMLI